MDLKGDTIFKERCLELTALLIVKSLDSGAAQVAVVSLVEVAKLARNACDALVARSTSARMQRAGNCPRAKRGVRSLQARGR